MADSDMGGLYRARVLNVDDPQRASRVQVSISSVIGEISNWAAACEPMPQLAVGDTVWVMFEAGDPNRPVCMGRLPR